MQSIVFIFSLFLEPIKDKDIMCEKDPIAIDLVFYQFDNVQN